MYSAGPTGLPDPFFVHTASDVCLGPADLGYNSYTFSSAVWAAASRALFMPFFITERHNYVRACVCNGTAVSGNLDVGVYDKSGNRLFSTGGTAQAGTSVIQKITIDWTLDPGDYYLALVLDNGTGTVFRAAPGQVANLDGAGAKQMASAYALPATATFADLTTLSIPLFGISEKSWI